MAISFAAFSSLISLLDFLPTFLGGSIEVLFSFDLFLVRILSTVGGGEVGGGDEGVTLGPLGEGGGDGGSSADRVSKGLEEEGKEGPDPEGWEGGVGVSEVAFGDVPWGGFDFFFLTISHASSGASTLLLETFDLDLVHLLAKCPYS